MEQRAPSASDVREPYEHVTYEKLRVEVARRGLRIIRSGPGKNYTKPGFMALLREHDQRVHASSGALPGGAAVAVAAARPARPSTFCRFRLLNVLFSDAFASQRAALHAVKSEKRVAAFWADVRDAFASDDVAFARRIADHACLANVQPGLFVLRSAQKLRAMWETLSRAHTRAVTAADVASPVDFFDVCDGNAAVYYLECWLRLRPETHVAVVTTPVDEARRPEPLRIAQLLTDDSVVDVLHKLLETQRERDTFDQRQQTQTQWLELVASIEQMREHAKRCRPGSEELADAEEDLRVALKRKRELREQVSQD